jgi:DNA-binding transcriptional LysR family regulator
MRSANYTLKQLKMFIEVGKRGSISKAAENLFVTQAAVSMQIKELETAFGVDLTELYGRNIRLTVAGEVFLEQVEKIISQLNSLENLMSSYASLNAGHIRLGMVSNAQYFVPNLMMDFIKQYPNTSFDLQIENREKMIDFMSDNLIDLAIMGRPPNHTEYHAEPFLSNPLGIVCSPEHAIATKKKVSLKELNNADFITREVGSGTRLIMERLFQKHKINTNVVLSVSNSETIKQSVIANMGLTFISLRAVQQEINAGSLKVLNVEGLPYISSWYITHRFKRNLPPAAIAFKEFILENAEKLIHS